MSAACKCGSLESHKPETRAFFIRAMAGSLLGDDLPLTPRNTAMLHARYGGEWGARLMAAKEWEAAHG